MEKSILKEMKALGCESPTKIALAYQLYVELCEVKVMHDVLYFYNSALDLIYLAAKDSKDGTAQIFIPAMANADISLDFIEKAQKCLANKTITIAFIETDTTVVFYTFTDGLAKVKDKSDSEKQKNKEQAKEMIDAELRKNKTKYARIACENGVIKN